MKKTLLCIVAIIGLCAAVAAQEKVAVAAAANLSAVKDDLSAAFAKKYPGYAAEFTFGSSGALVTQIKNGAPFQVFMSADTGFAQALVDAKLSTGEAKVYAIGRLILLTTRDLDLGAGLAVLKDPKVLQWANSNPETAPYGRAAVEALTKAGLYDAVKPKLVLAQNVSQALQFTMASADAGFVNKSALYSKELAPYDKEGKYWIEVDPKLYSPIAQAFVVVRSAEPSKATEAFASFLVSSEARAVFSAYGYGAP
jgi:molybdenum ABC transporter, periplasmic molybdate-binding protein